MTIEPTTDRELIRLAMVHPRVYPSISDDFSPAPQDFQPHIGPGTLYLAVYDGDNYLGCFLFVQWSPVMFEVHTCLLPAAYGAKATEAAKAAAEWMFHHTTCRRIITHVPQYNRLALRFAERAGLTQCGRNYQSYQKDGRLHDLIMLGLSKESI
jgi:RimJ/RimL family protein N-acetyltransferase